MDIYIRGIKAFCCHAPTQHTKHKTTRVPPKKCATLCGLLNAHTVLQSCFSRPAYGGLAFAKCIAADFTHCREVGCLFSYVIKMLVYRPCDRPQAQLFTWQCYIAKYP